MKMPFLVAFHKNSYHFTRIYCSLLTMPFQIAIIGITERMVFFMLGTRMKELRKESKMNQTELGKKIGVGRTTITAYECGDCVPPYEKLQAMAKVFGVSVKYLTGEVNSKNEVIDDVQDVTEVLSSLIDQLSNNLISMKIDGKQMNKETKQILAGQLKSALDMASYMNSLNKGEQ